MANPDKKNPVVVEKPKPEEKPETVKHSIESTDVTLRQEVLNLQTSVEEKIEFRQTRYKVKTFGQAEFDEALRIVGSQENAIKALLAFAESQSYRTGRDAVLNKGKYLTQEVRSRIVSFMRNLPQFQDDSAKDAFDKWLNGYKASKPGAKKILDTVLASAEETYEL